MFKKTQIIFCVLCAVAIGLSAAALIRSFTLPGQTDTQYVMYIGTNDKDSNQPILPFEEARVRAEEILLKHFDGFTIQNARGVWKDEGITYSEDTLVVYLSDTTLEKIHDASDELLPAFNQSSILIQSNRTVTEFYYGAR